MNTEKVRNKITITGPFPQKSDELKSLILHCEAQILKIFTADEVFRICSVSRLHKRLFLFLIWGKFQCSISLLDVYFNCRFIYEFQTIFHFSYLINYLQSLPANRPSKTSGSDERRELQYSQLLSVLMPHREILKCPK